MNSLQGRLFAYHAKSLDETDQHIPRANGRFRYDAAESCLSSTDPIAAVPRAVTVACVLSVSFYRLLPKS